MKIDVDILGSHWTITEESEEDNPKLRGCDGYTDSSVRKIVINDLKNASPDTAKEDLAAYKKRVLRHEIVHAFLEESGLSGSSSPVEHWADNEEMVDWLAVQLPKMLSVVLFVSAEMNKQTDESTSTEPRTLSEEDLIELEDRFGANVRSVVEDMMSGEGKRWKDELQRVPDGDH